MSIIIAIFQAILQAVAYILPISESGHAAVFRDFAGRADGIVSSLTGAIHIGIALGIFAASYSFFAKYAGEAVNTCKKLVKKQYSFNSATPSGKLAVLSLASFAPMLLWFVPLGSHGNLYKLLKSGAFNNTLLDEGLMFLLLGALIFAAVWKMSRNKATGFITLPAALAIGFCCVLLVPVSGLSLIGGAFAVLILFGIGKRLALKYSFLIGFPVLLVSGIAQVIRADNRYGIIAAIIGAVISAVISFFLVRVLKNIIKKGLLKFISYYDISLGIIIAIIGIVQLIVR